MEFNIRGGQVHDLFGFFLKGSVLLSHKGLGLLVHPLDLFKLLGLAPVASLFTLAIGPPSDSPDLLWPA
ncbi:hypothetical protein VNO80_15941 [Phaseolus coccineus]|uniref:Uncharacterized protein n=1 Tax=Phaseolus coccineus TaxID=3886 RepID=A0AAN9MMK2_PHACN